MATDYDHLERVFLKVGLAETDEQLQSILSKYLVPVLNKLSSQDGNVRTKVLELLAHLNKRLKSRDEIKLPLHDLLEQFNDGRLSSFVTNFTIIYIKTGFPRLSIEDRITFLPTLFSSLKGKIKTQQDIFLRLIIETFAHLRFLEDGKTKQVFEKFQLKSNPVETGMLLDFCLDVIIMPYSAPRHDSGVSSSGRPSTAPSASSTPPTPPGLSRNSFRRLLGDANSTKWTVDDIEAIKSSILKLIKLDVVDINQVIPHLVVASSDTRFGVATSADLLLRNNISMIFWNDRQLVTKLYKLYLGDAAVQKKKKVGPDDKTEPANVRMKLKLLQHMVRSKAAADAFPQTVQLVYDGLFASQNSKLKGLTLQFVHHIFESAETNMLEKQSPLLLDAVIKVIGAEDTDDKCQIVAYTSIGKLANKLPHLLSNRLDLLQQFVDSVHKEASMQVKMSIVEAVTAMASSYKHTPDSSSNVLESLIRSAISNEDHHTRVIGVRYAASIFPSTHVHSRYLLLMASADDKDEVAAEARRALDSNLHKMVEGSVQQLPAFSSMLRFVTQKAEEKLTNKQGHVIGTSWSPFPPKAFQSIIVFVYSCLSRDAGVEARVDEADDDRRRGSVSGVVTFIRQQLQQNTTEYVDLMSSFSRLICQYLKLVADVDVLRMLVEITSACCGVLAVPRLVLGDSPSAQHPAHEVQGHVTWAKSLATHSREEIRYCGAELFSILFYHDSASSSKYAALLKELLDIQLKTKNYEQRHGGILLIAHTLGDFVKLLVSNQPDRMMQDSDATAMSAALITNLVKVAREDDVSLASAACFALGEIARQVPLPIPDSSSDSSPLVQKKAVVEWLVDRLSHKTARKLRNRAAVALGRLPVGESPFPYIEHVMSALLATCETKDADQHFVIGEALCSAALGPNSPEAVNRWTGERQLPPSGGESGGDRMEWLLSEIVGKYVQHRLPAARQASCIWLITILKTEQCTRHPALLKNLMSLQEAFTSLLSESDELTQDIASKGFGVVYELGDSEQKQRLISDLVDSLTGSGKSPAPNKVRIIGEEGSGLFQGSSQQLGKAPDGSNLTTYKELCSLASDLNQPDLVYKFLHLANHHALWNTKKGAAFGFASIATSARTQLEPHLAQIVPRLYRYIFDPQPQVRAAMTSIWHVIAPEANKTIQKHLRVIVDDLVTNMTSNLWRTRQASCLAMSDLLKSGAAADASGASEDPVSRRLPEIWSTVFRVQDDVKETVRDAANKTCLVLKKRTVRMCDEQQGGKISEQVLTEVLSVLLNEGLLNQATEIRQASLSTLVEVSKVSSGSLIKPCIGQMVLSLMEALSGMEPPEINYLRNRSGQTTQDALDWARAELAKTSPYMETALRCVQYCDETVLADLMPGLLDLIKRGVGVPTKTGCAHLVSSMVTSCGSLLTPYTSKLINVFLSGMLDRSLAVRKVNSTAVGNLSRVAKDATLTKTFAKLRRWYLESEEETSRHASASGVYAVARHSPDVMTRHAVDILPLAFFATHEPDDASKKMKENAADSTLTTGDDTNFALSSKDMFEAVWNEFTPGLESAVRIYLDEIVTLAAGALTSNSWTSKAQAAATMSSLAKCQRSGANPHLDRLLQALLEGLRGRSWNGKHRLLEALADILTHCGSELQQSSIDQSMTVLVRESQRGRGAYRVQAISALASSSHHLAIDHLSAVWKAAHSCFATASGEEDSDDESTTTSKRALGAETDTLHKMLVESIEQAWISASTQSRDERGEEVVTKLADLCVTAAYQVRLASLHCLVIVVDSYVASPPTSSLDFLLPVVDDALCVSLGDMKYSNIRREAINVVSSLCTLIREASSMKTTRDRISRLSDSLHRISSLHTDFSEKTASTVKQVDDLLREFDHKQ